MGPGPFYLRAKLQELYHLGEVQLEKHILDFERCFLDGGYGPIPIALLVEGIAGGWMEGLGPRPGHEERLHWKNFK